MNQKETSQICNAPESRLDAIKNQFDNQICEMGKIIYDISGSIYKLNGFSEPVPNPSESKEPEDFCSYIEKNIMTFHSLNEKLNTIKNQLNQTI